MWHAKKIEDARAGLGVTEEGGLDEAEVARRREIHGPNKLKEGKRASILMMILAQLNDALIYILLVAALISGFLGEISDAVIIALVVVINAVVGVIQESKAEKALEALRKMSAPKALVRRGGKTFEIDSADIVPGDIVILEAGRVVPCDLRLAECANLRVDESALTGESVPVDKDADAVLPEKAPLGDRVNMAFMSTLVTYGRGVGIAAGTGMETQIGKIASMLGKEGQGTTPLQAKIEDFSKKLGIVILALCAAMFAVGLGEEILREGGLAHLVAGGERSQKLVLEMFMTAVSLAVAAIPEGLVAIITIVLAIGVQKMSRENAIVRRLPAVETLGSVSVICSDKTGTLTQNRMTVVKLWTADAGGSIAEGAGAISTTSGAVASAARPIEACSLSDDTTKALLESLSLCNDSTFDEASGISTGDPTESALLVAAARFKLSRAALEGSHPRVGELPFDSARKLMSTINREGSGYVCHTKGAADQLLRRCTHIRKGGADVAITEADRDAVKAAVEAMSKDALRVLGAARRAVAPSGEKPHSGESVHFDTENLEAGLCFVGLAGMIDPPRLEVKDSIALCRSAGISTAMITGDHKLTALAIAKDLGIASREEESLSGAEIDDLDDTALIERCRSVRVFARVSPEHKVRIVKSFKALGNIVSMTGDGVNDAPSLKAADIGVAMGITGTDVAKGASAMILTDDNFATIVSAIRAGRNIYANIRKAIHFLLSCNAGEIIAIFTTIVIGMASPLKPIHILWVNLVTDTFPALALGMDRDDPDAMKRKPRDSKDGLFSGGAGLRVVLGGIMIGGLTLAAYFLGLNLKPGDLPYAQTLAFCVLSFSQLIHSFNMRHERTSLFRLGLHTNPWLVGALVLGLVLQLGVVAIPPLAEVFKVEVLDARGWLIVSGLSVSPFFFGEARKLMIKLTSRGKEIR